MTNPTPAANRSPQLLALGGLGALLLYTYWPTLADMVHRWNTDPQYSHGYLVPAFALALLWLRRERLVQVKPGFHLWGVPLLALGAVMHLGGAYYYYDWIDAISLLPSLAGLCLLLGGRPAWGWAWPAVAFLVFMVPLPYQVENALSHPLQRFATVVTTYTLETLGFSAIADGNRILMDGIPLGVEQACNGLSMLVTFFALAAAVAFLCRRPLVDRLVILLSAIPIALAANVLRITATGALIQTMGLDDKQAQAFFHDWAGWFMMPLALVMLWVELWVLNHLLVQRPEADRKGPVLPGRSRTARRSRRHRVGTPVGGTAK